MKRGLYESVSLIEKISSSIYNGHLDIGRYLVKDLSPKAQFKTGAITAMVPSFAKLGLDGLGILKDMQGDNLATLSPEQHQVHADN